MRRNEQRFIKEVTRKMEKAGFKCIVKDDVFAIVKGDMPLQVSMCDILGWGRRRVRFVLNFALEGMDKVKKSGWNGSWLDMANIYDFEKNFSY